MTDTTFSSTITAPDGTIINLAGTLTYPQPPIPDTTLNPVKPWLMLYDVGLKSLGLDGTKLSVTGPDKEMQRLCGFNGPVNAGFRSYQSLPEYIVGRDEEVATHAALNQQRSLVCLFTRTGTTRDRFSNTEMRNILAGMRDEEARNVVRRGDWQRYFAILHEADNFGTRDGNNLDPALYRMALHHIMRVMIQEAQALGLTPNQFGVGGLLTGTGMGESLRWRWWDGLPFDLLDSNMVVCYHDTYWRPGAVDTVADRITEQTADARQKGVGRFVVAETAKYGTVREQKDWIDQLVGAILDGLIEGASVFHDPNGIASGDSPLRDEALKWFGYVSKRINR